MKLLRIPNQIVSLVCFNNFAIFYKELSKGGVEKIMKTKTTSLVVTKMADGAQVSYRVITSTEGSPAVEISLRTWNEKTQLYGLKAHKVHFIKRNVK